MPDREQILRELTHKDDGLDTSRRVYYTLAPAADKQVTTMAHNTARLVALLIEQLEKSGKLTAHEIDDMLLQIVT